jgi:hypothetical protein
MAVNHEAQVEVEDIGWGAAGVGYLVDKEVGTQEGRELDLAGPGYRQSGHLPISGMGLD